MPKIYYVNVYEYGREYGGPEEGGWYYDTGYDGYVWNTYLTEDSALEKAVDLAHRWPHVSVIVEEHLPQDWPVVKPHYE